MFENAGARTFARMIRVGHGRCVNTSQGPDGHHGVERSHLIVRLACRHHRERRSRRALGAEAGPSASPNPPKPQPPSLLVIFAEWLEATFSRKDIFGEDLTPQPTALAASGR